MTEPLFAQEVARLKHALLSAIDAEIEKFRASTGLTPRTIDVEMIDASTYGDAVARRIVSDVRVGFGEF